MSDLLANLKAVARVPQQPLQTWLERTFNRLIAWAAIATSSCARLPACSTVYKVPGTKCIGIALSPLVRFVYTIINSSLIVFARQSQRQAVDSVDFHPPPRYIPWFCFSPIFHSAFSLLVDFPTSARYKNSGSHHSGDGRIFYSMISNTPVRVRRVK